MTEVSPNELSERVRADEEDVLVLDVRHQEDYDDWHIPNSVNVDVYDELADDPEAAKDALEDLPDEREIVTVCAAGVVSQTATDVLREMGYDAATLTDGMNGWSRVHRSAPVQTDLDGTLVQVARPGKGCLSHVLISDGDAAVFDPSHYLDEYEAILDEHDAELVAVFDTHAHADHVSGGADLAERHDVPYYLHPKDALAIDATPVEDEATVEIGTVDVDVIHTPGHSEGSVSFDVDGEALITGDTLFHESVGRVELGVEAGIEESDVEGNAATLYESLQRLLDRADDTIVLPAHDPGSPEPPVNATLSEVRERNEDLGRDREEFVETLASDVPDHPPNFERVKRTNVGQEDVPDEELSELELGPNRCAAE
ncbi:MBL fold metallo-hydrolase [halophilic archaeon]|nr:MBL fold metallo-hydrolase [halophilic archaeon]